MTSFPNLEVADKKVKGLFYETSLGSIKVFVKSLPKFAHSDVRLLFDKEILLHQSLCHPNIVKLYDASMSTSEDPVMIFEFMNQGSLDTHFTNDPLSMSWERKLGIACDVARGIQCIHFNNMTHGNLLPCHVLLDENKPTKLTGLCSNEQADSQLEISAVQLNVTSCLYVAPEVILDDTQYEPPADVFAIGCIMWSLDIMNDIYSNYSAEKIEFRHIMDWISSGQFDLITREFTKDCPQWYVELAKECMRCDPSERPTIDQVIDHLENSS
ncbi:hypothetical protein THRCLA_02263 [Thraustotheca clavata]|uniref:Protein kinase domain-containing protein n=1 Tax=Thraustotheca clavata TaxID=74557 RepID=A0A1W0A5R8_9STRA|nr:hypothetical protein THRCLA_02263 [Thraustotheca clavata]